jgi:hypothetical protein
MTNPIPGAKSTRGENPLAGRPGISPLSTASPQDAIANDHPSRATAPVNPTTYQTALAYAERLGWRVLPLLRGDKTPLTRRGVVDASTDPEQIRRWFDVERPPNVGVRVGEGWAVVDIDPRNGGDESAERLRATFGRLPADTPRATTATGGRHILVAIPSGMTLSKRLPGFDGIDFIHGKNKYILVAPSTRVGSAYVWTVRPSQHSIKPAPDWLLELATPVVTPLPPPVARSSSNETRNYTRARLWLDRREGAREGHGGDTATFITACHLGVGFDLPFSEAFELLQMYNHRCTPPWDLRRLRRKLESAYADCSKAPGYKLTDRGGR